MAMTHRSIHRGVEFISKIKDQHSLQAWYDHLPENQVKASIKKIKCAEYRPYDQASFRVIVLCRHPLFDRLHGSESNPD
jgi:hypothetical protein